VRLVPERDDLDGNLAAPVGAKQARLAVVVEEVHAAILPLVEGCLRFLRPSTKRGVGTP